VILGLRLVGWLALIGLVAAGAFFLLVRQSTIEPVAATPPADQDLVVAGERIALLGNCAGCHTQPGGAPLAGGLPISTPFGTIHATNITPDPETGIGRWSEEAYVRAMRDGIDREGRHLYPAFPYPYYARVSDEDLRALYAWNMAQPPVVKADPENDLPFPFNIRALMAGWNLLFHDAGPFEPESQLTALENHGAYLARGLGHCGACHTARGLLGQETDARYGGGEAQGWHAPALTAANPAPAQWTAERLFAYLRTGRSPLHGGAGGPMATVVHDSLAHVPEADVEALAAYYDRLMARPGEEPEAGATLAAAHDRGYGPARGTHDTTMPPMGTRLGRDGAQLFAAACATCHHAGGPMPLPGPFPTLGLVTPVWAADPSNLVHVILWGVGPNEGDAGGYMPRFAEELGDGEIAAIASHLRDTIAGQGSVAAGLVADLREAGPVEGRGGGPLEGFGATLSGLEAPAADMGAAR
jgi:mono/diheme cytochrome c family protein